MALTQTQGAAFPWSRQGFSDRGSVSLIAVGILWIRMVISPVQRGGCRRNAKNSRVTGEESVRNFSLRLRLSNRELDFRWTAVRASKCGRLSDVE